MEHREIICKLATFCIKIMDLHIVVLEVMSMQTDAIWQILPESIKEALKKGGISLDSFEEIVCCKMNAKGKNPDAFS